MRILSFRRLTSSPKRTFKHFLEKRFQEAWIVGIHREITVPRLPKFKFKSDIHQRWAPYIRDKGKDTYKIIRHGDVIIVTLLAAVIFVVLRLATSCVLGRVSPWWSRQWDFPCLLDGTRRDYKVLYAERWIRKKRQETENLTAARGNRLQGERWPVLFLARNCQRATMHMNIELTIPSGISHSSRSADATENCRDTSSLAFSQFRSFARAQQTFCHSGRHFRSPYLSSARTVP